MRGGTFRNGNNRTGNGKIKTIVVIAAAAFAMAHAAPASQGPVQRGVYCARAGDCISCHTMQEEKPFAGGKPFTISVGKIYSTNITPDIETGIGRYGFDDFVKVMRQGIAKDGHRLYPAMPYPSYTKVSREDLSALYAFFMQGVKPLQNPNHPAKLNWLLGVRSYMAVWNALFFKKVEYVVDPNKNAPWNRGAYLVQGLGHCGDCHTPRGVGGQVKASSEKDGRLYLAGAELENWHASSLTGDYRTGLHVWPEGEIVEYLKTGRTARVGAAGMMAGVVGKSTQYLSDTDLMAIAEYLKSLPPSNDKGHSDADSAVQTNVISSAGDIGTRGSPVYLDNCGACHRSDGAGANRTFPNLARNEAVNAEDPVSLVHILLKGSSMPSTQTAPSALAMPDFGWRLTDAEIADVLAFVRARWGNHAKPVGRSEVDLIRKALDAQTAKTNKSKVQ